MATTPKGWKRIRASSNDSMTFIEDESDQSGSQRIQVEILYPNNAFTSTSNYVVRIERPFKKVYERKEYKTKNAALNFAFSYMRRH